VNRVVLANGMFRGVRERTPSRVFVGECVSRQELAEWVNAWVWGERGVRVEVDANYVGKLERGVIGWPSGVYREALRAVLGVASDAGLGFVNRRRAVVPLVGSEMNRGADGGLNSSAMALLERIQPTRIPVRVGATEISQIRTTAGVFANWDHTYGGGLARDAVLGQLRWSVALLGATCPTKLRGQLLSAVGYLAHTCGFMAFDDYAHDDARLIFRVGLNCAEEAGDWHLRGKMLSSMARQAIWISRPDEGLTLAEHALVRSDRITHIERSMLHTARARALAKMNREGECLHAIGSADEQFAGSSSQDNPAWMAYYDYAQHSGDTGHALFDLAIRGRLSRGAGARLGTAVDGHSATYARSRATSQVKLASLLMVTGDPVEATAIGEAAVSAVGHIRSRRAADDLRDLACHAGPHAAAPGVEALRRRIGKLVLMP
jgi:hypothetical protein